MVSHGLEIVQGKTAAALSLGRDVQCLWLNFVHLRDGRAQERHAGVRLRFLRCLGGAVGLLLLFLDWQVNRGF